VKYIFHALNITIRSSHNRYKKRYELPDFKPSSVVFICLHPSVEVFQQLEIFQRTTKAMFHVFGRCSIALLFLHTHSYGHP